MAIIIDINSALKTLTSPKLIHNPSRNSPWSFAIASPVDMSFQIKSSILIFNQLLSDFLQEIRMIFGAFQ